MTNCDNEIIPEKCGDDEQLMLKVLPSGRKNHTDFSGPSGSIAQIRLLLRIEYRLSQC